MKTNKGVLILLTLIIAMTIFWIFGSQKTLVNNSDRNIVQHSKIVRFGMLPYGDHTYAIIGVEKGWFKDVGIELQFSPIKVEEIVPQLKNGAKDVISTPPGILFAAYDNAPNLVSFVFGDLFQGYAVLANPNSTLLSFSDFLNKGLTEQDALRAVVKQFEGKTFAYPSEVAIKPFIDLLLEKGEVDKDSFTSLVLDDPLTVNAMRRGDADLQVGGVPSRIILEREGFKPIISSIDLAKMATPSASSKELASILQNGWATTREYYERERDTILRIASVNYRIMDYINSNPESAISIHMPYLSKISGQKFTKEDGEVIYKSLNPFYTFNDQFSWFFEDSDPLFYAHVNGAILNSFINEDVYQGNPPSVEDVIVADDIYKELYELKKESESFFREIENKGGEFVTSDSYLEAKSQYDNFNYLDSAKIARRILSN